MTTTTPEPAEGNAGRWLLKFTATAAHSDATAFEEQVEVLRSVAGFDPQSKTWHGYIGTLNPNALAKLQKLYDAARTWQTVVSLEMVQAPDTWNGPTFSDAGGSQPQPPPPPRTS